MPLTSTLLTPELLARLEQMELVSRKIFRGRMKGERRSPRKGQSVEFADFRNYVPGDDLRFVDWNSYARLEKLFLKMFLEEEDLHFYGLIDASALDGFRRADQVPLRHAVGGRLGVHRAGPGRPREDRNAGARPKRPGPGVPRPAEPVADARSSGIDSSPGRTFRWPRG